MPPVLKQAWSATLLIQVVFLVAFLSVGFWSSAARDLIIWRGLDEILIESTTAAFSRYMWCTAILGATIIVCTMSLRKRLQQQVAIKDLAVLILFNLGMFYIVATRCLQFTLVADDAYIDYRYVLHWLSGQLDYNPGERVMGFTSHLHLLLLGLVHSIFRWVDIPQISNGLNALLDAGTFAALYSYLKYIGAPRSAALLGAWMFALSIYSIYASASGKEFSLGAFLLVLSLWSWECQRLRTFAWASCGLVLTRPEGAIFGALAFVFSLKRRLSSVRDWVAPAVCVLVWMAMLFTYFGTVLPQGAVTKAVVYLKRNLPYECLLEIVRYIGLGSSGWIRFDELYDFSKISTIPLTLWGLVLLVVLGVLARKSQSILLYFLSVLSITAFYAIPNSRLFVWYMFWFLFVGIISYAGILKAIAQSDFLPFSLRGICAVSSFLLLLSPISLYPTTGSFQNPFFVWEVAYRRFVDYKKLAEYVKGQGGEQDEIAVPEPGVIGYFHPGPMLDMGGLVSSKVLKYYPKVASYQGRRTSWYDPPPSCLAVFRPKYICLLETSSFEKEPFFVENYKLEHEWQENFIGVKAMSLFVLKSADTSKTDKSHP